MNHQLNPIYTPQGVSMASMLTFEPPAVRHSSLIGPAQLTTKQHNHNIKLRAASQAATARRVSAKYKAAFGGEVRTISDLMRELKISRQGVTQQIRKYAKAGAVIRKSKVPHSKEVIWQWAGK